jgi:hypothetical protein
VTQHDPGSGILACEAAGPRRSPDSDEAREAMRCAGVSGACEFIKRSDPEEVENREES